MIIINHRLVLTIPSQHHNLAKEHCFVLETALKRGKEVFVCISQMEGRQNNTIDSSEDSPYLKGSDPISAIAS